MQPMTSFERVKNVLDLQPVDQCPVKLSPWTETIKLWTEQGHLKPDEDIVAHFDQDLRCGGWLKCVANLDHEDVVLEETDETVLKLDGNGAMLRRHKLHDSAPEHVDFTVKDRAGWQEKTKPFLLDVDRRRIPFEDYAKQRTLAQQEQRFFCCDGIAPFEQIHPVCGHEYMLMGMALDPDWVRDMAMTYAEFTIMHFETLFTQEGQPDGFFFCEDMGFKQRPFMSPTMYHDIIQPAHQRLFDYCHSLGGKVIVHSCGFVEPLVPGMIEAGMDCLQAMEVKAGMDMPHLFKKFGDKISFFGNIDARTLISNDRNLIEAEMQKKIPPVVNNGGGYILHSDHTEPPQVEHETAHWFLQRGREISKVPQ